MILPQQFLLISTLISAVSFIFFARLMVQMVNANFHNPVSQLLIRITRPVLKPLSTILPSTGMINWACVIILLLLQLLSIVAFVVIGGKVAPTALQAISWSAVGLVGLVFNFFYIAVIVWALLSWIARDGSNPMYSLLGEILAPAIRPLEKIIPTVGGLSFSAIAFIFILGFIQGSVMPILKHITQYYFGLM